MVEVALTIGKSDGVDFCLSAQTVVTGRTLVAATSGSGKSWTVAVLCEELCKRGVPFAVVDLEGEYWSIRDRYQVLWIGDRSQCNARWESIDFNKLAEEAPSSPPLILDFSLADHPERNVEAFLAAMWRRWKPLASEGVGEPYLIVIDEADQVLPVVGAYCESAFQIAVRARKRGLGLLLGTQQPSLILPKVLKECRGELMGCLTNDEADLNLIRPHFTEGVPDFTKLHPGHFYAMGTLCAPPRLGARSTIRIGA